MEPQDIQITRRGVLGLGLAALGTYTASQLPFSSVYARGESSHSPVKPIPRTEKYMLAASEEGAAAYSKAIDALKERHRRAELLIFRGKEIEEIEREVMAENPTHVQVICTPEEASIPQYTGSLDPDRRTLDAERALADGTLQVRLGKMLNRLGGGYRGAIAGVLTAYTPEDALRIAETGDFQVDNPLMVSPYEEIFNAYQNAAAYCGSERQNKAGGIVTRKRVDMVAVDILESLNRNDVGMFAIAGHGGSTGWVPMFISRERQSSAFVPSGREAYMADINEWEGDKCVVNLDKPIAKLLKSSNTKVFWGAATCRVGSISDKERSLLLGLLGSGGFTQAFGYETVNSYRDLDMAFVAEYMLNFPESSWFEAHRRAQIGLQFTLKRLREVREARGLPKTRSYHEIGHEDLANVFVGWGDCGTRATNLLDRSFVSTYTTSVEPRIEKGKRVVRVAVVANKDARVGDECMIGHPIVVDLKEDVNGYRISSASPSLDCEKGKDFVVLHPGREIIENSGGEIGFRYNNIHRGDRWFIELSSP